MQPAVQVSKKRSQNPFLVVLRSFLSGYNHFPVTRGLGRFERALKNERAAPLFKITNFSCITQYLKRPVETSRHLSILCAMRASSWLLLMLIGVAPAAFAQTTHLQGRLLGHDGQPTELAHVYLIELSGRLPRVTFGDPTSKTARFAQLYEDKSKRRGAFDLDW